MDNTLFPEFGDEEFDDIPPPSSLFASSSSSASAETVSTSMSSITHGSSGSLQLPVFRSVGTMSLSVPTPEEDDYWTSLSADTFDNVDADTVLGGDSFLSGHEMLSCKGTTAVKNASLPRFPELAPSSIIREASWDDNGFNGPQEEPFHVEKYSSFISDSQAPVLLNAIENALQTSGVETERRLSKYKIKASVAGGDTPCFFIARIYRSRKESGKNVVEFQRRSGCTVLFNHIYQRAMNLMKEEAHVDQPYVRNTERAESGVNEETSPEESTGWHVFTHNHHFIHSASCNTDNCEENCNKQEMVGACGCPVTHQTTEKKSVVTDGDLLCFSIDSLSIT